jgi:hypothetical protein
MTCDRVALASEVCQCRPSEQRTRGGGPRSSRPRRGWDLAAGALSLGVWALMPKCPMCIAAYVALWTGLGLSLAAATYLRWSLLLVSSAVLIYLIVKRRLPALAGGFVRRFMPNR